MPATFVFIWSSRPCIFVTCCLNAAICCACIAPRVPGAVLWALPADDCAAVPAGGVCGVVLCAISSDEDANNTASAMDFSLIQTSDLFRCDSSEFTMKPEKQSACFPRTVRLPNTSDAVTSKQKRRALDPALHEGSVLYES